MNSPSCNVERNYMANLSSYGSISCQQSTILWAEGVSLGIESSTLCQLMKTWLY